MSEIQFVRNVDVGGGGPFVVIAGAGLSLWHPASLPTWGEFNQILLEQAKARVARALRAEPEILHAIKGLTIDGIGSKALSNMLVEILAGGSYFEVVQGLDSAHPNPAHRAVARLVRQQVVAAIVTTNFDTLLEQALVDESIAVDLYAQPSDYWERPHSGCPVLKIHGSADDKNTLVDTVGQKLRGLAPYVRAQLSALFGKYPVIVLGYSGGDLEFGADYLALHCIPKGANRLWWVMRPEEEHNIDARVKQLVVDRGQIVLMPMAQALESLGAGAVTLEWNSAARAEVHQQLRAQAKAMYGRLGSVNTMAFCMRLLSITGQAQIAAALWRLIAATIDGRKKKTGRVLGPARLALAAEGHRLFGVGAQETWACRQLEDIHHRRTSRSDRDGLASESYLKDVHGEALACLALGDSLVRRGDDDGAGIAMESAMVACEYAGDFSLLSGVYRLYGWREVIRRKLLLSPGGRVADLSDPALEQLVRHEQTALGYLTAAEAVGLTAGSIAAMDSAWIKADFLMDLGEYDAALLNIERLQDRVGFGAHRETQVRIECLRGEIDLRQGRAAEAMARWRACLDGIARGNPLLEAYVKGGIVGRIGFLPEWRPAVLTHCDEILQGMESGLLPLDGRSDLLGTQPYFETVKRNLTSLGAQPLEPGFIQQLDLTEDVPAARRWPEHYLRQELIEEELYGTSDEVLHLLDMLVGCYRMSRNSRALEAARAHLRRAHKDGNEDQQFAAAANVAGIRYWLGDTREAPAWFIEALGSRRAKDPVARSGLERRLPHALWNSSDERFDPTWHDVELDLDDALSLIGIRPASGRDSELKATALFKEGDFVMGRMIALEGIAAYRDEGDPGGLRRCFDLLRTAGARDRRSGTSPLSLCRRIQLE